MFAETRVRDPRTSHNPTYVRSIVHKAGDMNSLTRLLKPTLTATEVTVRVGL